MIWVWTALSSLLAVIWKQEKMSLIIDLRNCARTNIQVILSKWNYFALGILKKKAKKTPKNPKKQQNLGRKRKKQINKKETQRNKARKDTLFNSQVLSILCLLESVRSVGSHCLLRIGPIFKKFCSYLSSLTVTEMYPYALQLNLCNCGRNSCACILILAITIKPFILCT